MKTPPLPPPSLETRQPRGVDPKRYYLFVIDGSKALRLAINRVFGSSSPV